MIIELQPHTSYPFGTWENIRGKYNAAWFEDEDYEIEENLVFSLERPGFNYRQCRHHHREVYGEWPEWGLPFDWYFVDTWYEGRECSAIWVWAMSAMQIAQREGDYGV